MHAQSGAERQKRARIIESEGERTSIQNYSEGETTSLDCNMFIAYVGLQVNASLTSTRARAPGSKPSTWRRACTSLIVFALFPIHFCHRSNKNYDIHKNARHRFQRSVIEAQAQVFGSIFFHFRRPSFAACHYRSTGFVYNCDGSSTQVFPPTFILKCAASNADFVVMPSRNSLLLECPLMKPRSCKCRIVVQSSTQDFRLAFVQLYF